MHSTNEMSPPIAAAPSKCEDRGREVIGSGRGGGPGRKQEGRARLVLVLVAMPQTPSPGIWHFTVLLLCKFCAEPGPSEPGGITRDHSPVYI